MTVELDKDKIFEDRDVAQADAWIRQLELAVQRADFAEIGRRAHLLDGLRSLLDMADNVHKLTDPDDLSRRERLRDWGETYVEGLSDPADRSWLLTWLEDEIRLRVGGSK